MFKNGTYRVLKDDMNGIDNVAFDLAHNNFYFTQNRELNLTEKVNYIDFSSSTSRNCCVQNKQ